MPASQYLIRGEYENNIRRDSKPEKVFQTFATVIDGEYVYMSHYDLFKSICPYSYSTKEPPSEEEREKYESRSLIEFADINKDGKISVYEYLLIIWFLQTSKQSCEKYFSDQKLNTINKKNLQDFFMYLKTMSQTKFTSTNMPDARKVQAHSQNLEKVVDQLSENLLLNKPQQQMKVEDLIQIREDIVRDMHKFEFDQFQQDSYGYISGEDFAKSLLSYLKPKAAKQHISLLNNCKFKGNVNFEQYYNFCKFLNEHLNLLQEVCQEKGYITPKRLQKVISDYYLKQNVTYNKQQIDIFIKVLDANRNNMIEFNELQNLVDARNFYGTQNNQSFESILKDLKQQGLVWMNKFERIWDIIME